MAKPSKLPEFALQLLHNPGPSRVDPVDLKDSGWLDGQKPPREYFNWLHWMYYEWIKYLDEENDSRISDIQDAQINIADLLTDVGDLHLNKLEETTGVFIAYLKASAGSESSTAMPIRWVRHGNLGTLSWSTTKITLSEPGLLYIELAEGFFDPMCAANSDINTKLGQTMPVCVYSNDENSQPGRLSLPYPSQDALALYRMIIVDGVPTFNQQFPAGECGIQAGNVTYVLESIS